MFGLTEEQKQLQSAVRAFAEGEIAPHVSEWDEKSEFPHEVVKKLGEMGLLGVIFPETLGGAGMGYVEYVLAIEELSRVDGSVGIIVAAHNSLCTNHIMLAGNDEQRKRWIPKLASGQWLGAWGLTEPGSGSDAGGARTTAVRKGDCWVLNGSKKYAQERRQFGKAISEFQAIQFKLANMATELDAAWLLTMRAAQMKDAGKKVTMESAMAKLYASEAACRICDEGLQIHGGYG